MNRILRMRRYNETTHTYETLFPQTITANVLRSDNGGVLESYLQLYDKHLMYPVPHLNRAISNGTHRHLIAHIPHKKLVNNFPLLLTLHTELDFEPTLDLNESGPKPIINGAGERIPGGQVPGAVLFMVYSEEKDAWIMLSNDNYNDVTRVMTPVEHTYWIEAQADDTTTIVIPGFNRSTMRLREVNYGQTVLIYQKDYDFDWTRKDTIILKSFSLIKGDVLYFIWNSYVTTARKGHTKYDIEHKYINLEIDEDNTTEFKINRDLDKSMAYEINYGQTKLREGLDFVRDGGTGKFELAFPLMKGDLLSIMTTELIEAAGDALPNNWGSTGTYRYSVDVVHGEFTSLEDGTTIIPVPEFNQRRDKISLIRENKVLVFDVDYTIDLLDQIVLLTGQLNKDETIYWTILRGAMVDVPNFNVIRASGVSGQHILVDIAWDQICDYYTLLIKLVEDLETAPTIKCINGPARPVLNCYGDPVTGGYKKGSYLWVVYNEDNKSWYSLGHGQMDITNRYPVVVTQEGDDYFHGNIPDEKWYGTEHELERVIPHNLGMAPTAIDIYPTEPPGKDNRDNPRTIGDVWYYADKDYLYVGNSGNALSKFHWRISNSEVSVDLKNYLENELAKLRKKTPDLTTNVEAIEITEDDTDFIPVSWWTWDEDIIFVNYGQTILREGIDFNRTPQGLSMATFKFVKGDIVQYTLVKQDDDEKLG